MIVSFIYFECVCCCLYVVLFVSLLFVVSIASTYVHVHMHHSNSAPQPISFSKKYIEQHMNVSYVCWCYCLSIVWIENRIDAFKYLLMYNVLTSFRFLLPSSQAVCLFTRLSAFAQRTRFIVFICLYEMCVVWNHFPFLCCRFSICSRVL